MKSSTPAQQGLLQALRDAPSPQQLYVRKLPCSSEESWCFIIGSGYVPLRDTVRVLLRKGLLVEVMITDPSYRVFREKT